MATYSLTILGTQPVIRARVVFPAEHVAFDGHFPGQPILPAFMQAQVALDVLGVALGKAAALGEVRAAKFLRPLGPGEAIDIEIQAEQDWYAVTLSVGEAVTSRF